MAIDHGTITIESAGRMPSLGAIMGTRVSSDVFNSINSRGHTSIFGEAYNHLYTDFYERHVRPMDNLTFEVSRTVNRLTNPDRIRLLDSIEAFESIPLSMEIPILMYEPVRRLFLEGRVEGFGYNPESLPDEDTYGRLLDNGTCYDVADAADDDGYFEVRSTMYSDDPDVDETELYDIRKTREYILNMILRDTDRDPTAIGLPRG